MIFLFSRFCITYIKVHGALKSHEAMNSFVLIETALLGRPLTLLLLRRFAKNSAIERNRFGEQHVPINSTDFNPRVHNKPHITFIDNKNVCEDYGLVVKA